MALIPVEARRIRLQTQLARRKVILEGLQQKRLFLGLTTLGFFGASQILSGYHMEKVALLALLPIYIFFLIRSRKEQNFQVKIRALHDFYAKQSKMDQGQPLDSDPLESFPNPDLARDLDLHELFAYLDMSISLQGQQKLKQWLCGEDSEITIPEKHQALKALAQSPGPLRRLQVLYPENKIDLTQIQKTIDLPLSENPPAWRWALPFLWLVSIGLLVGGLMLFAKICLFLYLAITLLYLQSTGASFSRVQSILGDLEGLEPIFLQLRRWDQKVIPGLKTLLSSEPHRGIKKFRVFVALMSLQGNPILFFLANFLIPWSLMIREFAEAQRKNLSRQFGPWKHEIIFLDGIGSLATLFIYHTKVLPHIAPGTPLETQGLLHPLIAKNQIVANDFNQENHKVFLITGSNMSGKSTFLRALGMNYCLAQMGAPVFAKSFSGPKSKIFSCIRVSDSLRDGQSYFYAEVRRLKTILDQAQAQPIIFLIDEPLRGTNNKERLEGNRAYLRKLLTTDAIGFLSTHDLEMTHLEKDIELLCNYHFTDIWRDEKLYFDYKIRKGPSQTTNALKIMAQEGLLEL